MSLKHFLPVLFLLLFGQLQSADLKIINQPTVYLSGVSYSFEFSEKTDSTQVLTLQNNSTELSVNSIINSKISNSFNIPSAGEWKVILNGKHISSINVIPGWLSLLPPFIAILLALITRQVLVALFAGIFFGASLLTGYNPLTGFLITLTDFIAVAPANPDNMAILVFSLTLGGMVGVISKSGGTQGIVERLTKHANTSKRGQLVTWALGILIFFDDYANTLIVGNTMRPLTDKLKISREKLAYLVDSTAAPIATVAIISTWIGYQLSLIDNSFKTIGLDQNAYITFIKTIPFNFYPLFALIFGFLIAYSGRDMFSMLQAERRALKENKLLRDDAVPLADTDNTDLIAEPGTPLRWYNGLIPVIFVIFITILGLWFTGVSNSKNIRSDIDFFQYISIIFGNADSYKVLIWAAFGGSFLAIILAISQRILTLHNAVMGWVGGVKAMLMAALILTMAWAIGNICSEIQTANYVIYLTEELLSPHWIPTLTFLIAGIIAFSTGTSWATMAILTPIVIPLAYQLPLNAAISAEVANEIFLSSIAAILAGATFGDHCSPISDTTIMSSMASGSDHIDHVRTQMPYAIIVAAISIIFGFIPVGFGLNIWLTLPMGLIIMILTVRFLGKKIE